MKKIIFFVLLALNISYAVEWERLNFKTVSSITSIVLNTQCFASDGTGLLGM